MSIIKILNKELQRNILINRLKECVIKDFFENKWNEEIHQSAFVVNKKNGN